METNCNKDEVGKLLKVLKETENENQPWMMCIPLPRVMQILYQTSFLKVDNPQNYADLLPGISFFCSGSSSDLQKYLSTLLREVKSFPNVDGVAKDLNPERFLISVFKENLITFEKYNLKLLDKIGIFFSQNLFQTQNKSVSVNKAFLQHNCFDSNEYVSHDDDDKYFYYAVSHDEHLFQISLLIQSQFLKKCNYSVTSIKIISSFAKQVQKHTNVDEWIKFFPPEFFELLFLINSPPCVSCNEHLSTDTDLENLSNQVQRVLCSFSDRDEDLKTIFCIFCEWLIHCSSVPVVRSLFISKIN
ncbi:UNVERIFIED_CONTAM: hypothetical protein RMT77_015590 [Armadillidium vulgare]